MSKMKNLNSLFLGLTFIFSVAFVAPNPLSKDHHLIPSSKSLSPENNQPPPLEGKIINKRYYAPKNVFSCRAEDFGQGFYYVQDKLWDVVACVVFDDSTAGFKKAEVIFIPQLANQTWDQKKLKSGFDGFGIGMLKDVDHAEGIVVLKEEMIGDKLFFAAVSVEKKERLRAPDGTNPPATLGYLAFQAEDKFVLLSNQVVTVPGQKHTPEAHIEKLKREILEFSKTFEFGPTPAQPAEKPVPAGS